MRRVGKKNLLDRLPPTLIVRDPDSGRIIYTNAEQQAEILRDAVTRMIDDQDDHSNPAPK